MPIAIYKQGLSSYFISDIVFCKDDATDIFNSVKNHRTPIRIQAHVSTSDFSDAFLIVGLANKDLNLLDAALLISGEPKFKRSVIMLIVNVDIKHVEEELLTDMHKDHITQLLAKAQLEEEERSKWH